VSSSWGINDPAGDTPRAALVAAGSLRAEFTPDPARLLTDLPADHALSPVPVTVSLFLLDVTNVNGAGERFSRRSISTSNGTTVVWFSTRRKFGSDHASLFGRAGAEQLQTIWSPAIMWPISPVNHRSRTQRSRYIPMETWNMKCD